MTAFLTFLLSFMGVIAASSRSNDTGGPNLENTSTKASLQRDVAEDDPGVAQHEVSSKSVETEHKKGMDHTNAGDDTSQTGHSVGHASMGDQPDAGGHSGTGGHTNTSENTGSGVHGGGSASHSGTDTGGHSGHGAHSGSYGRPHTEAMMQDHMAAMNLVPVDGATHIAISDGDWNDPQTWSGGEVPGGGAKVVIPEGIHLTYNHVSDVELFTVRVDGSLEFSSHTDSQMIVDTIVVTPGGAFTAGTVDNPISADATVDIIFANNGPIDTDWDPMLLSRGFVGHGDISIHGAEKDSHEKVIEDPMRGDTFLEFGEIPTGWEVGDKIVIAGTHYNGYQNLGSRTEYFEPEDEIRIITQIDSDGTIHFDDPLVHDHDTPRADLKTSVANYTRNVSFETQNGEDAEIFERAHVMFMHTDDVDVRYAEFSELGRTDKSETALNVSEFDTIDFDTNVKGRYSFHIHRSGVEDSDDPAIAIGNAVYGSPGWGFVHHDSHALFENNATYDTFGAGYVAESGNETGEWNDNIAIYAKGESWSTAKNGADVGNFDHGQTGDGFWFQGRLVASVDNIAASVNQGFVYFHRGGLGEMENIPLDSNTFDFPGALGHSDSVDPNAIPVLEFSGNETFASKSGLFVSKATPIQGHAINSYFEDFAAWNVFAGAQIEYTSHYILKDFDLVATDAEFPNMGKTGISFGSNTYDMTIVNASVDSFERGINLYKSFTANTPGVPEDHNFVVIDADFRSVALEYDNFDSTLDTVISRSDLPYETPDVQLDPLTYFDNGSGSSNGSRQVAFTGTKTDSLGETSFGESVDTIKLGFSQVRDLLDEEGYYETSDGQAYFLADVYFSDRLTGDIYKEVHPVLVQDDTAERFGAPYQYHSKVKFNGIRDLDADDDLTFDTAQLWATLTGGQVTLSEAALAEENDDLEMMEIH